MLRFEAWLIKVMMESADPVVRDASQSVEALVRLNGSFPVSYQWRYLPDDTLTAAISASVDKATREQVSRLYWRHIG
jgi:hypothetical protein